MSKPTEFPLYIEAKTKDELVKAMLINNMAHSAHFRYFDIQKDGSKWVAWFYADGTTHASMLRELMNGTSAK